MFSNILADAVLLLHLAFVIFALFGGLAVLFKPGVAWLHIPAALWSSFINLAGWICPLTPLENYFRAKAGLAGYQGGFVQHYIGRVLYPAVVPQNFDIVAAISVIVWNLLVYAFVIHSKLRRAK